MHINIDSYKNSMAWRACKCLMLPPYSPMINPIEYVFAKWKMQYRCCQHDYDDEVDNAIHQSANSITRADCMHYFQHTQSLYPKCAAMEDM